jgi:cell division protein FtsI/penicillin-binding protein 2
VKVFTALAYGARHQYIFPEVVCKGAASGCWYAAGHGQLDLVAAVGHSCNAYFLVLARAVNQQDVALVANSYRIAPPVVETAEARIGLGRGWLESPEAIALAYLALERRRHEPGAALIIEGLRQCARMGTAKACGPGVLAKTGTSVCVHKPAMPGDGWALGLFPEDAPRYAVVVREHGVPGAIAARVLADKIRRLREGR